MQRELRITIIVSIIILRTILTLILVCISCEVQATQCRKVENTYNCGSKGIYRRIGNRIFGPSNKQYLVQGKRVFGPNGDVYTLVGNRVFKNNQTSFTKQGSFVQGTDGSRFTQNENLFLGISDDFIPIEILLDSR